jgi:AraC-like DNA-binding protein
MRAILTAAYDTAAAPQHRIKEQLAGAASPPRTNFHSAVPSGGPNFSSIQGPSAGGIVAQPADPNHCERAMMHREHTKIDYFLSSVTGVEFLVGHLEGYQYSLHSHDTFIVGSLSHGRADISIRGRSYSLRAGHIVFCNPYEVHDGASRQGTMIYRASYPSEELLNDIAAEGSVRSNRGSVRFPQSVVYDPAGSALFLEAHESSQRGDCALEVQEKLFRAYAYCLTRYVGTPFAEPRDEAGPIDRVIALLCDSYQTRMTLSDLVDEAGIPRLRLIQAFRRQTGLTPHAFLINRRIDAAKKLLRRGERASVVAGATGFNDQAHLIRMFKARVGVTPGAYQKAVCRPCPTGKANLLEN